MNPKVQVGNTNGGCSIVMSVFVGGYSLFFLLSQSDLQSLVLVMLIDVSHIIQEDIQVEYGADLSRRHVRPHLSRGIPNDHLSGW